MIVRRTFIGGLAAAAVPLRQHPVFAQQGKIARIGFVSMFSSSSSNHVDLLREGLREFGWSEGKSFVIEGHFADGSLERARDMVRGLVRKQVDVLVARATEAAHIAKRETSSIPVVIMVADPLATGLVKSLSRPEANLTGMSLLGPDLAGKRLELLREIKPNLGTVGFLGSFQDPNGKTFAAQTIAAAKQLNITLHVSLVDGPGGITDSVFQEFQRNGVEGLIVQPIFTSRRGRILDLAKPLRLPIISNYRVFAEDGALLTFGPDDEVTTRRAAYYIDKILNGAKPTDLPIEQPTRFELAVNLRAAKSLGLTVPVTILTRADRVIE
jgi:putative ABC transport system substrate-binding protein